MSNRVTLSLQCVLTFPMDAPTLFHAKALGLLSEAKHTRPLPHSQRGTHGSLPQSHSLQEQPAAQGHQVHTQLLLTVQYLSRSWSQQQRQRVQRPRGHKRHGGERGPQPKQRWPDPDPDPAGPGRLWPCDSRPWLRGPGREREAGGHRAADRGVNGLADEQERNYTGKLKQPDR